MATVESRWVEGAAGGASSEGFLEGARVDPSKRGRHVMMPFNRGGSHGHATAGHLQLRPLPCPALLPPCRRGRARLSAHVTVMVGET